MILDSNIMNILKNWKYASDDDIILLKDALMPDDEDIKIRVTEHPNIDNDNNIFIEWYDIDVLQDGYIIANIIVFNTGKVIYYF